MGADSTTPANDGDERPTALQPGSRDASLRPRALLLLLASLAIGIALALALLENVFPAIPTDTQRLGTLLRAFESETPRPEVVIFGNSVSMSGIDARWLGENLPGRPTAWNCASTGQTLAEAYLLTQELPEGVHTVLYSISIGGVVDDPQPVHPQKYNTLYMNGFRPNETTRSTMYKIFGSDATEWMSRSRLSQVFASRSAVRQYVDHQLRILLRRDLALVQSTHDLFHPQPYEAKIDPKVTARFLELENARLEANGPVIAEGTLELARAILEQSTHAGRRIVFLFPPRHPRIVEAHAAGIAKLRRSFEATARSLRSEGPVDFIDATGLLESEQFIDDRHPTDEGADILSQFVARRLSGAADE